LIERVRLTPEFVDASRPPERGERWIADKEVEGFGLRLWATRSGEGKAFAVRASTVGGKIVRRTFNHKESSPYRYALLFGDTPGGIGSYLTYARQWASGEIARLKGRISWAQELENIRTRRAEQSLLRPVRKVAEDLLHDMRKRGLSEPYVYRLDKLFSVHLPGAIQDAALADVTSRQIAEALSAKNVSPTALRLVRAFVGRIFETAAAANPSLIGFADQIEEHIHLLQGDPHETGLGEFNKFTEDDYNILFRRLETELKYWQQAMCIRLSFEFWAPLYRLMGARWDGIVGQIWYPYPLSERRRNFIYGKRIDDRVNNLLGRVRQLGMESFGPNPYWFPSKSGRKFKHIRTVDTVWRNILYDMRAPYVPLRRVALAYRGSLFLLRAASRVLE
jgi:hypothetical protein